MLNYQMIDPNSAKLHFMKGSNYGQHDIPLHLHLELLQNMIAEDRGGDESKLYTACVTGKPARFDDANDRTRMNSDAGQHGGVPLNFMPPATYVALVELMCFEPHWWWINMRLEDFEKTVVTRYSPPVVYPDQAGAQDAQEQLFKQKLLEASLDFSHVLTASVGACNGPLFVEALGRALLNRKNAGGAKSGEQYLADTIMWILRPDMGGHMTSAPRGSVLADLLTELVLGYVDEQITIKLGSPTDMHILRRGEDYQIFTNSEARAEEVSGVIGVQLQTVGLSLEVDATKAAALSEAVMPWEVALFKQNASHPY